MQEQAVIMTITKEISDEWLKNNECNRPIIKSNLDYIKRQIVSGLYRYTGESIIISKTGKVLNGQHRLMGVSETGIPIRCLVCFGVDDDAFKNMDNGVPRTNSNRTKMPQTLCETILAYDAYILHTFRRKLSADEIVALYEEKKKYFDWAVSVKPHRRVLGRAPIWAAMVFYAESNFDRADVFARDFRNDCGIIPQANILKAWLYRTDSGGGVTARETTKRALYCAHCFEKDIAISRIGIIEVERAFK